MHRKKSFFVAQNEPSNAALSFRIDINNDPTRVGKFENIEGCSGTNAQADRALTFKTACPLNVLEDIETSNINIGKRFARLGLVSYIIIIVMIGCADDDTQFGTPLQRNKIAFAVGIDVIYVADIIASARRVKFNYQAIKALMLTNLHISNRAYR